MEFLKSFLETIGSYAANLIVKLIVASLVWFIGMKIAKTILKMIEKTDGMQNMDITARGFLMTAFKFILKGIVVVSVVAILGVSTASIIAVIGSCGVAIGLALQGSLSNFAGGIMLLIFKPFNVGDYIITPDASGTVEELSIFYTTLSTPDNVKVVVPNSVVSSNVISNTSAKETRRLSFSFIVAHSESVDDVKKIMLYTVNSDSRVLKDPVPQVVVSAYKENGVEITARCWVKNSDYWDVNFAITENIKQRFAECNVQIPTNKIDVNIIR